MRHNRLHSLSGQVTKHGDEVFLKLLAKVKGEVGEEHLLL